MKFTLAFLLLVCVAFQSTKSMKTDDAIVADVNSAIDWTKEKAADAIDATKDGMNWIKDKMGEAIPEKVKDVSAEIYDELKGAAGDMKDSAKDAAADVGDIIDDAMD